MSDRRRVTLVTFGFKYGPPPTNHYFDVSFLKNPARDARWSLFSSPDGEMRDFVMAQPAARAFVERASDFVAFLADLDDDVRVGLGCNAGRHRSVLLAQALADALSEKGFEVVLVHRERTFESQGELHRPADGEAPAHRLRAV
ncbi:MAG: RNase adapter RapZ [Planctomycetota bacterium]